MKKYFISLFIIISSLCGRVHAQSNLVPDITFGNSALADTKLVQPIGMDFDPTGEFIYIADNQNHNVKKYTRFGVYAATIGTSGKGAGQLQNPWDVKVDNSGNIWVVNSGNGTVIKYNASGTFVAEYGSMGSGDGKLYYPRAIEIDATGNFYVLEQYSGRIQKFNSSGVYQSQFGNAGAVKLNNPQDMAIDKNGNFWVANYGGNNIFKYNSSGVYQSSFGNAGFGDGQFFQLEGIDIDNSNAIYVCDDNRTQVFNTDGEFQYAIPERGYRILVKPNAKAIYWSNTSSIVKYADAPIMQVEDDKNIIVTGSNNSFGTLPYGKDSVLIYTIKNNAEEGILMLTEDVAITQLSGNSFSIQTASLAKSILPGSSSTFTVKYTANAVAKSSAAVRITNNSADDPTFSMTVNGSGSLATSLSGATAVKTVTVYPNPASDYLNIDLEQIDLIQLFNIQGEEVSVQKSLDNAQLRLGNLSKGVYMLRVKQNETIYMQRIMVY